MEKRNSSTERYGSPRLSRPDDPFDSNGHVELTEVQNSSMGYRAHTHEDGIPYEDDLHMHYEGEREEDEREDPNNDFDVITVEDGQSGGSLTPEEEAQYRSWVHWAIVVSWCSVCLDLIFAFCALYIAIKDKSVGIFGFSLENFLDVITSFLILWRFGGLSRAPLVVGNPEHDEKMERREQRAEVMIALLFVLLGSLTCLIALVVLYEKESPDDVLFVIVLAAVSILVLAVLAVIKFRLANALKSPSFRQDAWITTISSILSVGLLIGALIYHYDNNIWFVDCLVALPLGGALLIYGLKTLSTRKWWQSSFWRNYESNLPNHNVSIN